MPRPRRLSLLLLPLLVSVLTQAMPGRAQQPTSASARYAFADTTLLRDTLSLHFTNLFVTADSLQLTPDTLRAVMIRYRFTMGRLLHLSDSLGVTVDSVGPLMDREKFNPLATSARTANSFTYTSGYDIQRTTSTWTNGATYRMNHGPYYISNGTNIELQRITTSGVLSLRQNREATTEGGLTLSKGLSLGARSYQLRFFSADPGSPAAQDEKKDEYSFTGRAANNSKKLTSTLDVRSGYLNDVSAAAIKRGLSGSVDARVRLMRPGVFTHDLSGSVSGNISHTRPTTLLSELNTSDLSTALRGNLMVKQSSPVGLNVNYQLRNTRVESPLDVIVRTDTIRTTADTTLQEVHGGVINRIVTQNNSVDGTLRLRADNDRYLNLAGNLGVSGSLTGTRNDKGGHASLRWQVLGAALDANYGDTRSTSIYFRQRGGGGYDETGVSRSADAQLVRTFGGKVIGKLLTTISLDRYRYVTQPAHADSATPPSPRDAYRQSYRAEMLYNQSEQFSSGLALEVSLTRTINISKATTGSNTDMRTYRSEWRWTYHILQPLTITQSNQIEADYLQYPFSSDHNTLTLNYNTNTTLSAVLPGNFSIDVQHNATQNPQGTYTVQTDGLNALQLSDESRSYTLNVTARYSPTPALGIHVEPHYQAGDRAGTVNGVPQRQRLDKRLDFQGGVDLNLHVGARGMLTGRLSRAIQSQRSITYASGVPTISPRSETDYWNGNLQLTWNL